MFLKSSLIPPKLHFLKSSVFDIGLIRFGCNLFNVTHNPYRRTRRKISGSNNIVLKEQNRDNSSLGMQLAKQYREQSNNEPLSYYVQSDFTKWAQESEQAFADRYKQDNKVDFDTFLANYFSQAAKSGQVSN